jgi:uncharacterized membrane protein YdjX (TVP38/TMEM64 family)
MNGEPQPDEPAFARAFRRLGPAGWLAVAATFLPLLGTVTLLTSLTRLAPWLESHQTTGLAIYIAGFALLSGIAILPTHASAILGGWAFKFAEGFPAAMAGFLGGALIGYSIARRASGDRAVKLIEENPKWRAVYDALLGSGFWKTMLIVALLRLPPNSPFALTNLVLAATRVPLFAFIVGTLIGMMPRISLVVYLASHASELDFSLGKSWGMLAGGIVVLLIVFAIIGHIAKRAIDRLGGAAPRAQP